MSTKMKIDSLENTNAHNYSCLSNVEMTGLDLGVVIHRANDPRNVTRDLLEITMSPLVERELVPANAA